MEKETNNGFTNTAGTLDGFLSERRNNMEYSLVTPISPPFKNQKESKPPIAIYLRKTYIKYHNSESS